MIDACAALVIYVGKGVHDTSRVADLLDCEGSGFDFVYTGCKQ